MIIHLSCSSQYMLCKWLEKLVTSVKTIIDNLNEEFIALLISGGSLFQGNIVIPFNIYKTYVFFKKRWTFKAIYIQGFRCPTKKILVTSISVMTCCSL